MPRHQLEVPSHCKLPIYCPCSTHLMFVQLCALAQVPLAALPLAATGVLTRKLILEPVERTPPATCRDISWRFQAIANPIPRPCATHLMFVQLCALAQVPLAALPLAATGVLTRKLILEPVERTPPATCRDISWRFQAIANFLFLVLAPLISCSCSCVHSPRCLLQHYRWLQQVF